MTYFSNEQLEQFRTLGYFVVKAYRTPDKISQLDSEVLTLISRSYTEWNLKAGAVYPIIGDSSGLAGHNRVSHSLMVAQMASNLPTVAHDDLPQLVSLLRDHHLMLEQLSGAKVADVSRCLLNRQHYSASSQPLGRHFDAIGMNDDNETALSAVLPKYVAILTVMNQNTGAGIELVSAGGTVYRPVLNTGDLLLFDNVTLRHGVPALLQERISIGLRNYDHRCFHFVERREDGNPNAKYREIAEGYISDEIDCRQLFLEQLEKKSGRFLCR